MFRDIQIVMILVTNFAVASSVGIKRVDCIMNTLLCEEVPGTKRRIDASAMDIVQIDRSSERQPVLTQYQLTQQDSQLRVSL